MFKKLFFTAAIITSIAVAANAQSFTFDVPNPLITNTSGNSELVMDHYIKNITTNDTFSINWSIISENYPDFSWKLISLCDNKLCYNAGPDLAGGENHISNKINPGARGNFKADFNIPANAANGVGTLKVLVGITAGQSDTMVYQINKTPTGISVIKMNDNRVSVYPNPASNNTIEVYADKTLNASKISLIDIAGQVVMTSAVSKTTEITNLNIHALSKGTYLVRLTDNSGKAITTRKFIKE